MAGASLSGGCVRAMASATSCRSTGRLSGHSRALGANSSSISASLARSQRSRASSDSAAATGPDITAEASCHGWAISPDFISRSGAFDACSGVSQRAAVMSMPPQKASESSITAIFW